MADRGITIKRAPITVGIAKATDQLSTVPQSARGEYNRGGILTPPDAKNFAFTPADVASKWPQTIPKSSTPASSTNPKDIANTKGRTTVSRSAGSGSSEIPVPPSNTVTYYKMRAIDPDCGPLTYRTWVVSGTPDTTGALYSGTRCGASPLTDITIVSVWQVEV